MFFCLVRAIYRRNDPAGPNLQLGPKWNGVSNAVLKNATVKSVRNAVACMNYTYVMNTYLEKLNWKVFS